MDQLGDGRAVPPHLDQAPSTMSTATEERAGQRDRCVPGEPSPAQVNGDRDAGEGDGVAAGSASANGDRDRRGAPASGGSNGHAAVEGATRPAPALVDSAGSRAKRALDLGVTVAVLPAALVIAVVIAGLVLATSRGPVLFVQERVGHQGRRFRMVKFRTMRVDAEERLRSDPALWDQYVRNGYKLPAELDTRATPIGRFLRRSSLDELPQLANVLRGDMSLVGPRPVVPHELDMYGARADVYLGVKPGLTGWWQVNGRSGVGYPERVELDRYYAESWTLWLDVRILLRTPLTLLRGGGAY
jgi:exopolysaccharide production protein ExoY